MFEAVYIADSNNNLIYEYLINLSSPSFKSLINVLSNLSLKNNIIEINKHYSVYKFDTSNISIYTLNAADINPILPYNFILRLIDAIHDYFGSPLAIPKIESNTDTLTLLINQMLDDGIPNITDFNKLRDIVPFSSFLSQILSTTNQLNKPSQISNLPRSSDATGSPIPWRRSKVKYTNNEMYVDIIETVNIIMKSSAKTIGSTKQFDSAFYSTNSTTSLYQKNLVPVSASIDGQVNFTSRLTGVPYLQMILNCQGLNVNPQFHRCVKLDTWKLSNGTLSFIPPDGKFSLMSYYIDLDKFSKTDQMSMMGLVTVDFNYGLGTNKNEFEIKLHLPVTKGVSKIENLCVKIEANYSNLIAIKSSRSTHGDFSYKGDGKAEWNLRSISTGINPILYGSIITSDLDDIGLTESLVDTKVDKVFKPSLITLHYTNKGTLASGIKVDSLKIISAKGMSETVKPYKGVKYITKTGDFAIRT